MFTLILFSFDILINFFIAVENEFEENKYDHDLDIIAFNYLSSSFIVDFVATVPFDYIFDWVDFNTSIFKGLKIFKLFKLLKLLRMTKLISINNKHIKSFLGDSLIV